MCDRILAIKASSPAQDQRSVMTDSTAHPHALSHRAPMRAHRHALADCLLIVVGPAAALSALD